MRTFVFLAIVTFFGAVATVSAITEISFPIAELGNCADESSCFAYCDEPTNFDACMSFASSNGLADEEDISKYERTKQTLEQGSGPGGCTTATECESYCSDVNNIDTCIAFAEERGFINEEEIEEAKKVKAALDAGVQLPGGCTSKQSCESYCENPSNMEECFAFAEKAGIIKDDEREEATKALELMKSGQTPGGCTSRASCESYCSSEENQDECVEFGARTGRIPEDEQKKMKEMREKMEEMNENRMDEFNEETENYDVNKIQDEIDEYKIEEYPEEMQYYDDDEEREEERDFFFDQEPRSVEESGISEHESDDDLQSYEDYDTRYDSDMNNITQGEAEDGVTHEEYDSRYDDSEYNTDYENRDENYQYKNEHEGDSADYSQDITVEQPGNITTPENMYENNFQTEQRSYINRLLNRAVTNVRNILAI
jgi:hypothetical protein